MKGVMLQTFEWFTNKDPHLWVVLKNRIRELKEAGFTAFWLPPAYKGIGGRDDVGYGIYDLYDLGEFDAKGSIATKYGTREEFLELLQTCKEEGIDVYLDTVLNHKMGADENEIVRAYEVNKENREEIISDLETIEVATKFTFPARQGKYSSRIWTHEDFDGIDYEVSTHKNSCYLFEGKSWDNEVDDEQGNYDYLMGADLDFSNPEVQKECQRWGQWFYDTCHNEGFRLDAVKHINAYFYRDWIRLLKEYTQKDLFFVGEYWHGNVDKLTHYLDEVEREMSLFDVPLHYNMYEASTSNGEYDMRHIFDHTLVQVEPTHAVTFVDNHDTQKGAGLESFIDDWFKPHAYALILLREEGYPCVFAGDYDGIEQYDISSKEYMINAYLEVRKKMSGARHDYFDHPDIIGWSYEGEQEGFAVLMTNAKGGKKRMFVGKQYAYRTFTDWKHYVNIDAKGEGIFVVEDGQCSVYQLDQ